MSHYRVHLSKAIFGSSRIERRVKLGFLTSRVVEAESGSGIECMYS